LRVDVSNCRTARSPREGGFPAFSGHLRHPARIEPKPAIGGHAETRSRQAGDKRKTSRISRRRPSAARLAGRPSARRWPPARPPAGAASSRPLLPGLAGRGRCTRSRSAEGRSAGPASAPRPAARRPGPGERRT
jgi:hypothetical protein